MNKTGVLIFFLVSAVFLTGNTEIQITDRPSGYFKDSSNLSSGILKNLKTMEKKIAGKLSEGYEILDYNVGDINGDKRSDLILILKWKDEKNTSDVVDHPEPRPLLLLINNGLELILTAHNKNVVYCIDCGGIWGDPYSGITVKGDYFSIEHYGGSNWRWSKIITFKYYSDEKKWYLHKVGGEFFHTSEPKKIKVEIKTKRDFGKIEFSKFNIMDF
jgi:hypothetical protein